MKRLKNYDKTVVGIEYRLFSIILKTGVSRLTNVIANRFYMYYVYSFFDKRMIKIKSCHVRVNWLNKYTLPVICLLYNLLELVLFIFYYPVLYFIGMYEFLLNKTVISGVDFFHKVNFIIILPVLVYILIFK